MAADHLRTSPIRNSCMILHGCDILNLVTLLLFPDDGETFCSAMITLQQ